VSQLDLPEPNLTLMSVQVAGDPVDMDFISEAPDFPPFLADVTSAEVRSTKTISFATNPFGHHTIDGKQFDDTTGQLVRLNRAEEWKVENFTNPQNAPIDHPFHIHINPFQVTEVFDPNEVLVGADGQPLKDAAGNPLNKYVFDKSALIQPDLQCLLDEKDPDTWFNCHNELAGPNKIWWDVFPIPTGRQLADKVVIPGYFKMRSRFVDYPGWYVIHCHILAHEDRGMMTVVEVTPFLPPVAHH
jgi:FtsP/CotA-like multicopper oxidase with cupredoxin domain